MDWVYDDGGRTDAGFRGTANDCVCRSVAIATARPYREVYDLINELAQTERRGKRKRGKSSARSGVYKRTTRKLMDRLGWAWHPTMAIGSGCKVHLTDGELPSGRLVVSVSKHITAIIDGVIHDTHDPRRQTVWYRGNEVDHVSERCVYGYWAAP